MKFDTRGIFKNLLRKFNFHSICQEQQEI